MSYKLLVVTFPYDILQFRMFCYCLAKNWQGQRNLIVAMGQGTRADVIQRVVQQHFDSTWTVEIFPTVPTNLGGDVEQQINKMVRSIESGVDDVIVFDSKDFLLRACDIDVFVKQGKQRYTYRLPGKLINMGYDIGHIMEQSVDHLPAVSNLTPWIWNTAQLGQCWTHLNKKFGAYTHWTSFHAQSEIYSYYIYVWTQDPQPIMFCQQQDSPLLFAGGYTHQTHAGMLREADDFEKYPERIIWKHSRKLQDPRCLDVTKSVLEKHGIDSEFVQSVYG